LPLSTAEGGPFPAKPVPAGLNWDMWLGQAPLVDYCPERSHFTFRWWYEYSGGIMTDWGAHHMDAAHWALDTAGPLAIDGSPTKMPGIPGGYNTPKYPIVRYAYPNDVLLEVVAENEGVTFEGDKGRIFVNRGRITGAPIEEQDANPQLKQQTLEAAKALFKGNTAKLGDHMGNFFEAFKHNLPTVSDVVSQHRTVSACHLGNISMRLGRKIQWDAAKEEIVGDAEAAAMLKREQRKPYEFG
jgi:myo-inositol 2-dehydrogenase / D-chiro-inositol 1-dehydrogenase